VEIPWLIYAGSFSQGLPLLVALIRHQELGKARKWILIWCGFLVSMSALSLILARANQNNHWMSYVLTPVAAAMVLWGLSCWQPSAQPTLAVRVLIPLLILAWIPIVLLVEDTRKFSLLGEPFAGLVVLIAAVYTLAARTLRETGRIPRQDWFWATTGIAIYHGTVVALHPTSYWLLQKHRELVVQVLQAKSVVEIVAFLTISWGMVLPPSPARTTLRG